MNTEIREANLDNIQGNILRGYNYDLVRHLILEITDRSAARRFLGASAAGNSDEVPAIRRATLWAKDEKPLSCFNIGVTYEGLKALGLSARSLASFPTEFIEGMTTRAAKIGDYDESAPENWPAPFDRPAKLHVVATVYSDDLEELERVKGQVAKAFNVLGLRDGRGLANGNVFFGYKDGISQPRFEKVQDFDTDGSDEPVDPLGTILLGYPTTFENLRYRVPQPDALGLDGSFNAFRVLAQDAKGFEDYLDDAATKLLSHDDVDLLLAPGEEHRIGEGLDRHGALREVVAAQMCGRWRNGVSYSKSPGGQLPFPDNRWDLTNFDYDRASRCPVGSHLRRANPRGGLIVQRIANYTRRLVRRGMSYGPDFDPAHRDGAERGLLGNFIGANIGAQFEAVMCDWINLGLQDPDITGSNDPLIGANQKETSWFDLSLSNSKKKIRLRGFPRFVTARGGAYTFLPSLPAIRYLAGLTD